MEKTNRCHDGSFFPGFVFGALVGGGLVFLLGTPSGKKVLRTLSEEGLHELSTLMEEHMPEEEMVEEEESEDVSSSTPETPVKEPSKRFFRGTLKKKGKKKG